MSRIDVKLPFAVTADRDFRLFRLSGYPHETVKVEPEAAAPSSAGCLTSPSGEIVPLTKGEFALLTALLQSPQRLLSREHLLGASRVHDNEVFDRSTDIQILRPRRKIESLFQRSSPACRQNVRAEIRRKSSARSTSACLGQGIDHRRRPRRRNEHARPAARRPTSVLNTHPEAP